jgi:hypothetical protein
LLTTNVINRQDFEPVQEEPTLSPDSRGLADQEEYCRHELPRFFRSCLETAINDETELLEERIRNQLVSMIQDCLDRVFSAYRSRLASIRETPPPFLQESWYKTPPDAHGISSDLGASDLVPLQTNAENRPDLRNVQNLNPPGDNHSFDPRYLMRPPHCACEGLCRCFSQIISFRTQDSTKASNTHYDNYDSVQIEGGNQGLLTHREPTYISSSQFDLSDPNFDWAFGVEAIEPGGI